MNRPAPTFDRDRLIRLFDELSQELRDGRATAQVYVIGGAAMSLGFSRDRRTEDVDARIDHGHAALLQATRRVARRHGLKDSWLNEQATAAIPRTPDGQARTLYSSAFLTITGASARHLLAMKLNAARGKDVHDIEILTRTLDLRSKGEAVAIYQALFPDTPLKKAADEILDACFARPEDDRYSDI